MSVIWDSVATYFQQEEHTDIAIDKENYKYIWPILEDVIKKLIHKDEKRHYCAFDFGCGTGIFAEKLSCLQFDTYACDISREMIAQASLFRDCEAIYEVGGIEVLEKYAPYNLILSTMVLQFIDDIQAIIKKLVECLDENGILFIAIHNSEYVSECMDYNVKFRNVKNNNWLDNVEILIGSSWIKTYIRNTEWYDEMFSKEGLEKIGCSLSSPKPPIELSMENIQNWKSSKYYIAWYKKKGKQ